MYKRYTEVFMPRLQNRRIFARHIFFGMGRFFLHGSMGVLIVMVVFMVVLLIIGNGHSDISVFMIVVVLGNGYANLSLVITSVLAC